MNVIYIMTCMVTFTLLTLQDFCTDYLDFMFNREILLQGLEALYNQYLSFDAENKVLSQ